jgi:ribosomal protein S12 methylthiotransferase accessory factor
MSALASPAAEGARAETPPRALKRYFHGTHRTCTPEETLARLQPVLPEIGITRIANLTGLDRVGVPVAMAVRPNARSVSISQGKGVTLAAAKASAVMESLEVWHAERIVKPLKLASAREMRGEHRIADVSQLPRAAGGRYSDALPLLWIEAEDLMDGGSVWVPFELASANYTLPLPTGSGCFQANTNGLASGNHWLEAVSHALCEVVERDARTLWQRASRIQDQRVLDPDGIDDPACRSVLARIAAAGLSARIWDITTDIGVASFACVVSGRDEDDADPELGSGSHPVKHIALLRAITEACQARLIYIAAARDEYYPDLYTAAARRARREIFGRMLETQAPQCTYAHVPSFESASIEADLRWMLARLRAAGIEQVCAVDLTRAALGIAVARVIVPGLEGALDEAYTPGRRALRQLRRAP